MQNNDQGKRNFNSEEKEILKEAIKPHLKAINDTRKSKLILKEKQRA